MFGKNDKTKIDNFVETARYIVAADPNGLTATQKKALAVISDKLEDAKADTLPALLEALTKKKAPRRKAAPRKKAPAKPAMSSEALNRILSELNGLASSRPDFESKVDALNKKHSAPEMKKIAANFTAGARPKTKTEAVRILKAERNDRQRATEKANEAGRSTPW
jgi:hypothetical protein